MIRPWRAAKLSFKKYVRLSILTSIILLLTGCDTGGSSPAPSPRYDRSDYESCSVEDKTLNLWEYLNEWYLWYDDLPNIQPLNYSSSDELMRAMRKLPEDRFSHVISGTEFGNFITGSYYGYGFRWNENSISNHMVMEAVYKGAFSSNTNTYSGTPAYDIGLRRGDIILGITSNNIVYDAADVVSIMSGEDPLGRTVEDLLGPNEQGYEIFIEWESLDGEYESGTMARSTVIANGVHEAASLEHSSKTIGYLSYQSFGSHTQNELYSALEWLGTQNIEELVVDLRYNPGGSVSLSRDLGSYIHQPNETGETFSALKYNDNSDRTPISEFQDKAYLFNNVPDAFNLDRVFVLTSVETCSASEMLINSLTPYMDVVVIGDSTCGKPIGFSLISYCSEQGPDIEEVYFAVNFRAENAQGFYDYFDGLEPTTNCYVEEESKADWGSTQDPLMAEVISYLDVGFCSGDNATASQRVKSSASDAANDTWVNNLMRKNLY